MCHIFISMRPIKIPHDKKAAWQSLRDAVTEIIQCYMMKDYSSHSVPMYKIFISLIFDFITIIHTRIINIINNASLFTRFLFYI